MGDAHIKTSWASLMQKGDKKRQKRQDKNSFYPLLMMKKNNRMKIPEKRKNQKNILRKFWT